MEPPLHPTQTSGEAARAEGREAQNIQKDQDEKQAEEES